MQNSIKNTIIGILAISILSLSVCIPTDISANDEAESTSELTQLEEDVYTFTYTPPATLADSKELYKQYLEENMYPDNSRIAAYGVFGESESSPLNAVEMQLYQGLKEGGARIADGKTSSALISVSGLGDLSDLDFNLAMGMVLEDCPYNFYWFDKTVDSSVTVATSQVTGLSTLTMYCNVSADYSASGKTNTTEVDTKKTSAASEVKAVAQAVVYANKNKSDYEKIVAYRDYVYSATEYNYDALEPSVTYGDPWQLIYVFDNDPDTNVVCEGYTKAFQYLCDLSTFEGDVFCMAASGTLISPSITGAHMWCVLYIDGKSYLIDLSNSDTGMAASGGELFMAIPTSGSYSSGYTINVKGTDIKYVYNSESKNTYGEEYLTLASEPYVVPSEDIATIINGKEETYSSFEEAIEAINNSSGGEIHLLKDMGCSEEISIQKPCSIYTNGYTLDLASYNITSNKALDIYGKGKIKSSSSGAVILSNKGLSLQDATIANYGTGLALEGNELEIVSGTLIGGVAVRGDSTIDGGIFEGEVNLYDNAIINDGTFKGKVTVCDNFNIPRFYGGTYGYGMSSEQVSIKSSEEIHSSLGEDKMFFDVNGADVDSSDNQIYGQVCVSKALEYTVSCTQNGVEKKYTSLSKAVQAASGNSKIVLLKDVALSDDIVFSSECELDINGFVLDCAEDTISSENGKVKIKDSIISDKPSYITVGENIEIESGYYGEINAVNANLSDVLAEGKGLKTSDGEWFPEEELSILTSARDVTVKDIPIKTFTVSEGLVVEAGYTEPIVIAAESDNPDALITWYSGSSYLGEGSTYKIPDTLEVGDYVYTAKAAYDGYTITKEITITVSSHIIKQDEVELAETSNFTKEYDGTDNCSGVYTMIKSGVIGNAEPIPVECTAKYNSANVAEANTVTITLTPIHTQEYTIPKGLTFNCSGSINKSVHLTPNPPVAKNVTSSKIELYAIDGGEYSIDGQHWQNSPVFENLLPNHSYSFYQRIASDDNHIESLPSEGISVQTLKTMLSRVVLDCYSYTYNEQSQIPQITVIDESGNTVDESQYDVDYSGNTIDAGNILVRIKSKDNGDYSGELSTEYSIAKAVPDIGSVTVKNIIYTSTPVTNNLLCRSAETIPGELRFLDVDAFKAGSHSYKYEFIPENGNYNQIEGSISITAIKDNVVKLSSEGELLKSSYTYGEKFSIEGLKINAEYESGQILDVTNKVNYNNGLKAGQTSVVLEYEGQTIEVNISVEKANPQDVNIPSELKVLYGSRLSEISLPDGWEWVNPQQTLETVGQKEFQAVYTPVDTINYNTITVNIPVNVYLEAPETATGNKAVYGQMLSEIDLPHGWSWDNPSQVINNIGKNTYGVTYGIDGEKEQVTLNVSPAELTINTAIVCNKEYDGKTTAVVESISFNGFVNDDNSVDYSYFAAFDSSDSGENKDVIVEVSIESPYYKLSNDTIHAKASILKAKPDIQIPELISTDDMSIQFLYDIDLGDGWSWDESFASIDGPGVYTFTATYTPKDSNYTTITTEITIKVSECPHINYSINTIPADCINNGHVSHTCDDCGEVIYQEELIASHLWSSKSIIIKPTCENEGLSAVKCNICDAIRPGTQEVLPPTGHNGGTATCKSGAVCDKCAEIYTLPAEHNWEKRLTSDENYHWYECTMCTEKTDKEKHHFKNDSCTECGYEITIADKVENKFEESFNLIFYDVAAGAGLYNESDIIDDSDNKTIRNIVFSSMLVAIPVIMVAVSRKKQSKR